jgi:hypothetical protein
MFFFKNEDSMAGCIIVISQQNVSLSSFSGVRVALWEIRLATDHK